MTFDSYQALTERTMAYRDRLYPVLGLMDEAGEIAALFKRELRDRSMVSMSDLKDELGDALWYIARIADDNGILLSEVADRNISKLADRKARGVIQGKGGDR